jgi:hypothetical protein
VRQEFVAFLDPTRFATVGRKYQQSCIVVRLHLPRFATRLHALSLFDSKLGDYQDDDVGIFASLINDKMSATGREGMYIKKVRKPLTWGANAYHCFQAPRELRTTLSQVHARVQLVAGHIKPGARQLSFWTEDLDTTGPQFSQRSVD